MPYIFKDIRAEKEKLDSSQTVLTSMLGIRNKPLNNLFYISNLPLHCPSKSNGILIADEVKYA